MKNKNINIKMLSREIKNKINYSQLNKVTYKDLEILLKCYMSGDYSEAHKTKLYNNHGGAYCFYLEILHGNYNNLCCINE